MIRCKEVYFPNPGPREPFPSTQYKRHWPGTPAEGSTDCYLILFDPATRVFHMRRRASVDAQGNEVFSGNVRTVDATHAEFTPWEVPEEVKKHSMPPLLVKK